MRRILHIDMDAFFAAVEQRRRPELIGKPVVIGGDGDPRKRGVVSTASYEARKFGIHSAMPLITAYKLCPSAVFLPVDYDEYSRVSTIFKSVLLELTPGIEDVGIDEAYMDISEIALSDAEIASVIKNGILTKTGLTCSIGIAPNKLLAKIASDFQKPDGLTVLTMSDVQAKIWPLPVRRLHGVGPKTEGYLKGMGIMTIGDLASQSPERLTEEFGPSYGAYLFEASHGLDESPVVTHWEPKSMSRETTFQRDTTSWQVISVTLAELTRDVVHHMRESGYKGRTITVKVKYADFTKVTRAKSIPQPTCGEEAVRRAAFDCLKRIDLKKKIRLIGIRVGSLEKTGQSQ